MRICPSCGTEHWFKLVETGQKTFGPKGEELTGLRFRWTTKEEVERELAEFTAEALDLGIARNQQ